MVISNMSGTKKQIKLSVIVRSLLIVFALYILLIGSLLYFTAFDSALVRSTVKYIPYPALMIGTDMARVSEVKEKLDSVKMFYENQDFPGLGARVDFSTPEGEKRLKVKEKYLLNKIIENKLIEKECEKRGIKLTDEIISQEVDRKLKEYGSEKELKSNLKKLYGWTVADFQENIVKPDMYKEKLIASFKNNDPSTIQAKNKIEAAEKELEARSDFSEIAKKYSEGESAKESGDLGWFSAPEMLPEIATIVFFLKEGETSSIIESSLGYHIIKVEEKKTEEEIDMVKLRQVFTRTKTLADWLEEKSAETNVRVFLRDFYWDKEKGQLEFKDETMRNFEKELQENFSGDVSVIF